MSVMLSIITFCCQKGWQIEAFLPIAFSELLCQSFTLGEGRWAGILETELLRPTSACLKMWTDSVWEITNKKTFKCLGQMLITLSFHRANRRCFSYLITLINFEGFFLSVLFCCFGVESNFNFYVYSCCVFMATSQTDFICMHTYSLIEMVVIHYNLEFFKLVRWLLLLFWGF